MKYVSLSGVVSKTSDSSIPLGTLRTTSLGGVFMRVRLSTSESVLPVAGSPLGFRGTLAASAYKVTSDISNSGSARLCGVCMTTPTTTLPYMWMLIHGDPYRIAGVTIKTDTNVANSGKLVWKADKVFGQRTAQSTSLAPLNNIGVAWAADSGSQLLVANINGMGAVTS